MSKTQIHLTSRVEGQTACGEEAEAVGPTLWFATPKADRCRDCAAAEVEGQCLVIGRVDVRIVCDSRKQFAEVIGQLVDHPRAYIKGWVESYYHPQHTQPRGQKTLEAIQAVAENLDNLGIDETDYKRGPQGD